MSQELPQWVKPRGYLSYALLVDGAALRDAVRRRFNYEAISACIVGVAAAVATAIADGWELGRIMSWIASAALLGAATFILVLVAASSRNVLKTYNEVVGIAIRQRDELDSRKHDANDALLNLIYDGKALLDGFPHIDTGKLYDTIKKWKIAVESATLRYSGNLDFTQLDFATADRADASTWAKDMIARLEHSHYKTGGVVGTETEKFILDHRIDLILHLDRLDFLRERWVSRNLMPKTD